MAIDLERRQSVMGRSRKLGHCICNPMQSCPCTIFIESNLCPCAGERPPQKVEKVALTRMVRKAGCSSKIGQADLHQILGQLPPITDPRVLLGTAAGDDAGIYALRDGLNLVQTVDVFTPCVDDPFLFGQIAAANSVSDIYAMGAAPLTALSVVGFPIESMDGTIMAEMLCGGISKLNEAGCSLIGGHSVNDEEIKLGFAVTGVLDAQRAIERDRAKPGDLLVLTKPLGTGMVSFAAQIGRVSSECLNRAGEWMATLNRDAAELMAGMGAHACTDVTGFGLAGHLTAMVNGSHVDAEIDLELLPVFGTAVACMREDVYGGAVDRNQAHVMRHIRVMENTAAWGLPILCDPQTSGGLLIALPPDAAKAYVTAMQDRGHEAVSIIGRIVERPASRTESEIRVRGARFERCYEPSMPLDDPTEDHSVPVETPIADLDCCCAPPADATEPTHETPTATRSDATLDMFVAFMKEASKPGLIDQHNKRLMAIILSIAHQCHPCLKMHLEAAVKSGIPRPMIDEAVNLAVSFGGGPALMMYRSIASELGLS